jgi:hypothetical protein
MYFSITLDPLVILNMLLILMNTAVKQTAKISLIIEPQAETLRYGEYELLFSSETKTFSEANDYCNSQRSALFVIFPELDLDLMTKRIDSNSIWTGIRKVHMTLKDWDNYSPLTITNKQQQISMSNVVIETMTSSQHIILNRKALDVIGKYEYEYKIVNENEKHTAICMKQLVFPERVEDVKNALMLKNTIEVMFKNKQFRIMRKIEKMKSFIATLPEQDAISFPEQTFDLHTTTVSTVQEIIDRIANVLETFSDLQSVADFNHIATNLQYQLSAIEFLINDMFDVFYHPTNLFKGNMLEKYKWEERNILPAVLYKTFQQPKNYIFEIKTINEDTVIPTFSIQNTTIYDFVNTKTFWKITAVDIVLIVLTVLGTIILTISVCVNCVRIFQNRRKIQEKRTYSQSSYTIKNPIEETPTVLHRKCTRMQKSRKITLPTTKRRNRINRSVQFNTTTQSVNIPKPLWAEDSSEE